MGLAPFTVVAPEHTARAVDVLLSPTQVAGQAHSRNPTRMNKSNVLTKQLKNEQEKTLVLFQ